MFSWRFILLILNATVLGVFAHAKVTAPQMDDIDPRTSGFHYAFQGMQAPGGIWKADYSHPDYWLATAWTDQRAVYTGDGLELSVYRDGDRGKPFTGAEIHAKGSHHYGRYEVVMRPARGSGLVSSFFTWTGPREGNPKDEIDIEFVGRDTTRVQLNYFTDAKSYGGAWIDLPYDAADHAQLYAFEWDRDEIRWYIGDQLVYRADGSKLALPTHAGHAIMNVWAAHDRLAGWTGPTTFPDGASATYYCISYAPPGDWGTRCSDDFQTDLPPIEGLDVTLDAQS